MILLTRLGGSEFVVNADQIQYLEQTPDTVIVMMNGARMLVHESMDAVVARVVAFRRRIMHGPEIVESPRNSES